MNRHFLIFLITVILLLKPVHAELDPKEANVTAVEFEQSTDKDYDFSVTLFHDDDGEDGYANFWLVETTSGEELGRRDLTHPHGTQEFTRSAIITIPTPMIVVVRGHDQTHGFGGQAMLIDLDTGQKELVEQGSDLIDFSDITALNNSLNTLNSASNQLSSPSIIFSTLSCVVAMVAYQIRKN